MTTFSRFIHLNNLHRAYRWVRSNDDPFYKSFFRDSYTAYALSSAKNLSDLRLRLDRGYYNPEHASKIYLPKADGGLRCITLLSVEDQIVYQAFSNVIAESLSAKVKHRYKTSVFHHRYAGKHSTFFYIRWQNSYKLYSNKVRSCIRNGDQWVANFDLAAFYDSIDHGVIKHFLDELRFDLDLTSFIMSCLRVWTSNTWTTKQAIYIEHGIPQGPVTSGMLSELVLQHIDKSFDKQKGNYVRYVDDIKLFAKTEHLLRQKLIRLDFAAREIGLFPQSSKINIRYVIDPETEIKSISNPAEPSVWPAVDQNKLVKRIKELSRRGRVRRNDVTRFKYLLAKASPSSKLNKFMLAVLANHPELYRTICAYLSKYPRLPDSVGKEIIELVKKNEQYHVLNGELLASVLSSVQGALEGRVR